MSLDLHKLTSDYQYYAENVQKIRTESRRLIPFIFNTEQQRLHKIWEWQLRTTGMVRLIILKDRRIGCSTYVDGRSYHQVTTVPLTHAFVVTHDKNSLGKIFGMSKLFWEMTPSPLRPMKRYDNTTLLRFENPNEKARLTNPGLRSSMEVFSANTGNASRSGGYSIAHFSEVAFYNNAETLITSTVPSVMDLPGSIVVYESTGNGRSGFFYEQWKKAKKSLKATRKLSNFIPVFFGWLTFPEYQKPFKNEKEKQDFLSTLDEEEIFLRDKHKATYEQLNWRRSKIFDFDDDIDKFHQEYPTTDEEAFISRGLPYFPKRTLLQLRNLCKPPWKQGDVVEVGGQPQFIEDENGPLKIWEPPLSTGAYVISADVGEGINENGDPSTIQVVKEGLPYKQVAEYRVNMDPVHFAGKLALMGKWYNEGLIVPEGNGPGLTTIAELKNIYSNIYEWKMIDRFKNTSKKLGWDTNPSTKPILCNYMSACLSANILEINSEDLIDEMLSFIRNTTASGEADYNCHDDLLMAYMIGVFCLASEGGSLLQNMGKFTWEGEGKLEQRSNEDKIAQMVYQYGLKATHDLDGLNILTNEEGLVDSRDNGWLNY